VAQIEEFARRVGELSGGTIRVVTVTDAAKSAPADAAGWDQEVARQVAAGEAEMGLVPSRAWESMGVTSLQALTAPFLVADETVLSSVVSGDLVDPLLSGLGEAGVQGLALWPEGLRHPFSFGGPLLTPDDFAGIVVRAPSAPATEALFAALGATTSDVDGAAFTTAVADRDVDAMESSLTLATGRTPAPAVVTGNVTFFPKVNVLVLNEDSATELGTERVAILRDAARATTTWAVSESVAEADAAQYFCAAGGTVVVASDPQLEALRSATTPVMDELSTDEMTAELMGKIEQITTSGPAAITPCAPTDGSTGPTPDPDTPPAISDGVYRYDTPFEYLLAAGIPETQARADAGVITATMKDGVYTERWRNETVGDKTCTGSYVVSGNRMFMTWTPGEGCVGAWSAVATVKGDTVTWSEIQAIPPDTPDLTDDWKVYMGRPWTRIGDAQ
jgi:TRAP-type C4-dicarboxylate transport system substrate-binding protein